MVVSKIANTFNFWGLFVTLDSSFVFLTLRVALYSLNTHRA